MTPRENMLRTIRCDNPEWIPLVAYADPFNHPKPDSLPEPLAGLFREKVMNWDTCWETIIPLSEYLGINEYTLFPPALIRTKLSGSVEKLDYSENGIYISKIRTQSGEIEERIQNGFRVKRYITTPEDVDVFQEYVESWQYELMPENIAELRRRKALIGDNGILWHGVGGTPFGMMYRFYSDILHLCWKLKAYSRFPHSLLQNSRQSLLHFLFQNLRKGHFHR